MIGFTFAPLPFPVLLEVLLDSPVPQIILNVILDVLLDVGPGADRLARAPQRRRARRGVLFAIGDRDLDGRRVRRRDREAREAHEDRGRRVAIDHEVAHRRRRRGLGGRRRRDASQVRRGAIIASRRQARQPEQRRQDQRALGHAA